MRNLFFASLGALALAAGTAQAVTVKATQADDVSIDVGGSTLSVGQNINGDQFTFSWDISGGDTDIAGFSAAFEFFLPGNARITFDDYVNPGSPEQTGFVLYEVGGPVLTA